MRTRVFADYTTQGSERDYYYDGVNYAFDRPIFYTARRSFSAMLDIVTPKFRSLIANGVIINNPMTYVNSGVEQDPAVIESSGICYGRMHQFRRVYPLGDIHPNEIGLPMKDSFTAADQYVALYNDNMAQALQKAHSNIAVNEAMALASLGELPETVRWMASIVKRGVKTTRYCLNKKSVLKDAKKIKRWMYSRSPLDAAMDSWMEMRYAIRPLVFEMEQCIQAARSIVHKNLRQTARGLVRQNFANTTSTTVTNDFEFTLTHKLVNQHKFRAGVLFQVEDDLNGMMALWGLDQPIQALYELTPLSFVLDWFFNVGDVIGAWAPKAGLSNLTSWSSAEIFIRGSFELSGFRDFDPARCSSSTSFSLVKNPKVSYVTHIRKRVANPILSAMPTCRINLDTAKIVDLCAIGKSLLKI